MSQINGNRENTPPGDGPHHQLFDQARTALNAGDQAEAERLALAALVEKNDYAPALELAGVLACQQGRFEQGAEHFQKLVSMAPDHPGALFNLGNALHSAGRSSDALGHLTKADAIAPGNPNLNVLLGMVLKQLGRPDEAIGRLEHALTSAPEHVPALIALGNCHAEQGRYDLAREAFGRAAAISPRVLELRHSLGNVMLELGEFRAAAEEYRAALTLEPRHADSRAGLAAALSGLGQYEEALYHQEKALRSNPDHPTVRYAIIDTLEHLGRTDEACQRLTDALRRAPTDVNLIFLKARLDMRAGNPQSARDAVASVDPDRVPEPLAPRFFAEACAAYDACAQTEDAIAAMMRANRAQERNWQRLTGDETATQQGGNTFVRGVAAVQEWLDDNPASTTLPPADGPGPVFILGFPRSGTTLMGRILDGHTGLHVADERPALRALAQEMNAERGPYPSILAELDATAAIGWRQRYAAAMPATDEHLVDKMPFNMIHLGLIRALYPEAPIVFMLRDPRDVVLSCLMQPFQLNSAMANFLALDTTAALYDRVMDVWTRSAERFKGPLLTVRYEDLVATPTTELERVCSHLQVDVDPEMLNFHQRAVGGITTPSRRQVAQPLYTSAVGRWKRYQAYLQPEMELLTPWVERFGYH